MTALETGANAPDFTLPSVGGEQFSLHDALQRGPAVLAFFKITCPVCQLAFPFIERLYKAHNRGKVTFVGVSQNDLSGTNAFLKEYGITFPVLLDDRSRYPVSNAFGITNVPTVFLVGPDGEIEQSIVGWDRNEMELLHRRLTELAESTPPQLFLPGEDVPQFKAG